MSVLMLPYASHCQVYYYRKYPAAVPDNSEGQSGQHGCKPLSKVKSSLGDDALADGDLCTAPAPAHLSQNEL